MKEHVVQMEYHRILSKEFRDKIQNDLRKHSDLREKTRNQGEQDERRMYCM